MRTVKATTAIALVLAVCLFLAAQVYIASRT